MLKATRSPASPAYVSLLSHHPSLRPLTVLLLHFQSGTVQSVSTTADGKRRIHFSFGYYTFDASVADDYKTLTLTMRNPRGNTSEPFSLSAMHINPASVRSAAVYTGALEWSSYAKSELTTLVVPYGVANGAFFGLYHQWTVDSGGIQKANHPVNGVFEDVAIAPDGSVTAKFSAPYYTYTFSFSADLRDGKWVLSNPGGAKSRDNKLALTYEL